jgi:protein-S-isoprenylcysteine O-methyltransferase Ste14
VRIGAFQAIYLAGLIATGVLRAGWKWRRRGQAVAIRARSGLDLVLLSVAGLGFALPLVFIFSSWLSFADYELPDWAGWLGVGVFAAALALLWRAHADLGPNWSPFLELRDGHELVTSGVYRRIRHPMYAAHWLWGIAQALLLHNWIAGPGFLVLFLPLYLVRVPREERMMLERFGQGYREYMTRTGRIVPRLGGGA